MVQALFLSARRRRCSRLWFAVEPLLLTPCARRSRLLCRPQPFPVWLGRVTSEGLRNRSLTHQLSYGPWSEPGPGRALNWIQTRALVDRNTPAQAIKVTSLSAKTADLVAAP